MGQVSEIATKRPKIVCELIVGNWSNIQISTLRVSKHKAVHKNFNNLHLLYQLVKQTFYQILAPSDFTGSLTSSVVFSALNI